MKNIKVSSPRLLAVLLAAAGSLSLAGCATSMDPYYGSGYGSTYGSGYGSTYGSGYGYGDRDRYDRRVMAYGTVESVRQVSLRDDDRGIGTGAVLGAIVGGAIGNQLGEGSGRTAATVAGAAVGGYIGNRIEDNRNDSTMGVEVVVRLDNGQRVAVVQRYTQRLYRGQRVRIVGSSSNDARVEGI